MASLVAATFIAVLPWAFSNTATRFRSRLGISRPLSDAGSRWVFGVLSVVNVLVVLFVAHSLVLFFPAVIYCLRPVPAYLQKLAGAGRLGHLLSSGWPARFFKP